MAIAAANASYDGNGPAVSGQVVAQAGLRGNAAQMVLGTATFTGDGASTSATLNYIDGTATMGMGSPSVILCSRSGGSASASIDVVSIVDANDSGKTATVTFSAAPGNGTTVIVSFMLVK